jgi:DNA helicase II / ATP-dependent DNA helicase PcrA
MQAVPAMRKKPRRKKKPARLNLPWSQYQQDIFRDTRDGEGNTIVLAAPGSGKSATLTESLYHIPQNLLNNHQVLYTAFNSSTAQHLRDLVPDGADSKTFHQLGFHTVQPEWGPVYGIDGRAVDKDGEVAELLAIAEVGDTEQSKKLRKNLVMAMSLAKTKLANTIEEIDLVAADHGLDSCGLSGQAFANIVLNMMHKTRLEPQMLNGHRVISFDDMIWLPYVHGWKPQQYERIFVDEAQDLSAARTELVLSALAPNGRLCATGDVFQAIYGFCGATPAVINHLQHELNAKYLPLSVSYRLPRKVIELAQKINPAIEAASGAIEGEIIPTQASLITQMVTPGSAVLSRTNFPLVQLVFQLLARGIRATIQGRDIGNRFLWRIWCWEPDTVEQLKARCGAWRDEVVEILAARNRPYDRIIDEAQSILRFTEGANTVQDVRDRIKTFFSDAPGVQVKLSSTHKAKGLEWNDVFVLEKTYHPDRGDEERNIWYVGITRSMKRLFIATGDL